MVERRAKFLWREKGGARKPVSLSLSLSLSSQTKDDLKVG